MTAKVLYTKKGTDAATIKWPAAGPPSEQWTLTDGSALVIPGLIVYGDGTITFPDGRTLPLQTSQGSTVAHQKGTTV